MVAMSYPTGTVRINAVAETSQVAYPGDARTGKLPFKALRNGELELFGPLVRKIPDDQ